MRYSVRVIGLLAMFIQLSACGGGSGAGGDGPPGGGGGTPPTVTVGGTISGLAGTVELQNNSDALTVSANGAFQFGTSLSVGSPYSVSVKTQPANQVCQVAAGSGTTGTSNVTNIAVTCVTNAPNTFSVSGEVTGLTGSVVLTNTAGSGHSEDLTLGTNSHFTFPTPIATGDSYAVTVKTQPANQACVVTNGTGIIGSAAVTNVVVNCPGTTTTSYTLGGTVTGLAGTGLTLHNGTTDLPITANGSFTFAGSLPDGSAYDVKVTAQPGSPPQACTVTNGSGTISGANVTNVSIACMTILSLISSDPDNGDTHWPWNKGMQFSFSAPLDASTVTSDSVTLTQTGSTTAIPVVLDVVDNQIRINSTVPLVAFTDYTVTVSPGVRGAAGEPLPEAVTIGFTTDQTWAGSNFLSAIHPAPAPELEALELPQVAADLNGDAIAVWGESDGAHFHVRASRYAAGDHWGPAQTLDNSQFGDTGLPQVAMDAQGNALATWQQPDTNGIVHLFSSVFTVVGGGWSGALQVDGSAASISNPQLAMDAAGNAMAVWQVVTGAVSHVWSNTHSSSGWDVPHQIDIVPTGYAANPQVVVDSAHITMAVWTQLDAANSNGIWAGRYAGTAWQDVRQIEAHTSGAVTTPRVALTPQGNALAVWVNGSNANTSLWSSSYDHTSTTWNTAVQVETGNTLLGHLAGPAFSNIGIDGNGNAMVVWLKAEAGDQTGTVWASRLAANGTAWDAPVQFPNAVASLNSNPQLAVDVAGSALAVWVSATDPPNARVQSERYTTAGGWSRAVVENNFAVVDEYPQICSAGSGRAVAVWRQLGGGMRIWGNIFY